MGRWILGMDNSMKGKERMIDHLLKCEQGMKDTLKQIYDTACKLEMYLENEKQHILLNEIYQLARKYEREPSVNEKLQAQKEEIEELKEQVRRLTMTHLREMEGDE